jgi:hypothetical protein
MFITTQYGPGASTFPLSRIQKHEKVTLYLGHFLFCFHFLKAPDMDNRSDQSIIFVSHLQLRTIYALTALDLIFLLFSLKADIRKSFPERFPKYFGSKNRFSRSMKQSCTTSRPNFRCYILLARVHHPNSWASASSSPCFQRRMSLVFFPQVRKSEIFRFSTLSISAKRMPSSQIR